MTSWKPCLLINRLLGYLTSGPSITCDLQILKQESTQQHTCPICRTFLHSDSASTYPTNFAILDILPRILRLQHGASFTPLPDYTAPLDAVGSDSDSDAPGRSMPFGSEASTAALPTPMPSMAATAALFPQLPWLQERVDLPLRLLDLLSVAQGQGTTLRTRVADQLAAKYKLPADAIRILQPSSTPLHTSSQTESPIRQGAASSEIVVLKQPLPAVSSLPSGHMLTQRSLSQSVACARLECRAIALATPGVQHWLMLCD